MISEKNFLLIFLVLVITLASEANKSLSPKAQRDDDSKYFTLSKTPIIDLTTRCSLHYQCGIRKRCIFKRPWGYVAAKENCDKKCFGPQEYCDNSNGKVICRCTAPYVRSEDRCIMKCSTNNDCESIFPIAPLCGENRFCIRKCSLDEECDNMEVCGERSYCVDACYGKCPKTTCSYSELPHKWTCAYTMATLYG